MMRPNAPHAVIVACALIAVTLGSNGNSRCAVEAFQPLLSPASTVSTGGAAGRAVRPAAPSRPTPPKSSSLRSAASDGGSEDLDVGALSKYAAAAATQLALFSGAFRAIDAGIAAAGIDPSSVPLPAVGLVFYACALKSRVFNPLNNQRPNISEGRPAGFRDRVMPSWTPPGVFFPIMWLLIIGPIRAYTSALVFAETGTFFDVAHMSLILHLTVGDIWNTINNTERRYGVSVVGVLGVVASVAFAAYQYYQVDPFAGKLLGATALWLCTASALIINTWILNPRPDGTRDPLYPVVGEATTDFAWFKPSSSE